MIPKNCPLSDKHKLQATLRTQCLLEEVSDKFDFCLKCPYSAENKKQKLDEASYEEQLRYWLKLAGIDKSEEKEE